MNSTGDGARGGRASCMWVSSSRRSPLRRLHGPHAVTTFSQTESPPRERGTTWSSVRRRRAVAAVDAAPSVPREERAPRDAPLDRARHPDVGDEADHVRAGVGVRRRPQRLVEPLDDLGLPLPDEHVRTPCGAHVQGLVARIEDQDVAHAARNVAGALVPDFVRESTKSSTTALSRTWRFSTAGEKRLAGHGPLDRLRPPPARGRATACRAPAPSRRHVRSPGPGWPSPRCRCASSRGTRTTPTAGLRRPRTRRTARRTCSSRRRPRAGRPSSALRRPRRRPGGGRRSGPGERPRSRRRPRSTRRGSPADRAAGRRTRRQAASVASSASRSGDRRDRLSGRPAIGRSPERAAGALTTARA